MATATRTPTRTATRTPTATPTVTPNISMIDIVGCILDRQYVTAHFVIWYTLAGQCAIMNTDEITFRTALGNGLEAGFLTFNNTLGYQLPATNQPYQVYVVSLQARGLSLDPFNPNARTRAAGISLPPGVIFIDQHYTADIGALGAHEFFHTIQWSYQQACMLSIPGYTLQYPVHWFPDQNEDLRWWMETTATWAQREAVTTDRSYINPIRTYLQNPPPPNVSGPWRHIDARPVQPQIGDNFAYSPLFPYYLVEQIGAGRNIIRTSWEQYRDRGNCGPLKYVLNRYVLPAGQQMQDIFPDYAEANYFLQYANENEFRTAPAHDLGINYRPASDQRTLGDQNPSVTGPQPQYGGRLIQYLGAGYVEFGKNFGVPNLGRRLSIRVTLSVFNPSTSPVVKLWVVTQVAPPRSSTTIVPQVRWVRQNPSGYDEYVAEATVPNFDNDQLQWVAMEVVYPQTNPQTGGSMLSWRYQADVIAPTPTPTRTPTSTSTPTLMAARTATPILTR
jgi:hypothetical protein